MVDVFRAFTSAFGAVGRNRPAGYLVRADRQRVMIGEDVAFSFRSLALPIFFRVRS